ncbi:MAG TPA: ABC transporter substrate-binding protein [Anaerolineae bacterium]|nr:ABC transporter substrate-binding protein [Anaerolineae bacterium]
MQPMTFFLDWIMNSQFAGLCWALEKGLYASAGLDVTLVPWVEDGRTIIEKVVSGGVCAGSSEDNLIVLGNLAGAGVKALGVMLQESPLVLMTKPESGIRSLVDLPGRRVAMHIDGIHILEAVLSLNGLERAEVEITQVTWDLNHLIEDRFDAVQGYAIAEPVTLAAMGVEVHLIPIRHQQLHPYAQVFFASDACLEQHPDLLQRFLKASFTGWQQAMNRRDEAARLVVKCSNGQANLATEREVLERMYPFVTGQIGLSRFGLVDAERWDHNLDSYARFGITSRKITRAATVDDRFLQAIYPP